MEDKTRYVLYVVILGLVVGGLGTILSGALDVDSANRVPIATFFLVCICVFLVLFNYEPLKTPREIEQALIKRVNDAWIADLINFERGLVDGSLFPINSSFTSDAVVNPRTLKPSIDNLNQPAIVRAFEGTNNSMLILGEPGSGKTVSLLQLARVLVERAEKNPAAPLPVVLSLATWRGEDLEAWLVAELRIRYDVAEEVARSWILGRRLFFLFDDLKLDNKARYVEQLNRFIEEIGTEGLVVTTRELPSDARLNVSGAVRLEKLGEGYVKRILDEIRITHPAADHIAEIAKTPIMLRVISAAPDVVLADLKSVSDLERSKQQILNAYVTHRLTSAGRIKAPYASSKLGTWLSWLAVRSQVVSRPVFSIEDLQPDWLRTTRQQKSYVFGSRVLGAITIMLLGVAIMFLSDRMGRLVGSDSFTFGFIKIRDGLGSWLIITGIFGGFIIGLLEYVRLMPWPPDSLKAKLSRVLRASLLWANLLVCFFIFLGLALAFRFDPQTSTRAAAAFAVAFAFTYWNRDRERTISNDLTTAHKLVWAGAYIPKGLHWGLVGGYLCGLVYLTFKLAEFSIPLRSSEYLIHGVSLVAFFVGVAWGPKHAKEDQRSHGIINSRFECGLSLATWVGILTALVGWWLLDLTRAPKILWLSCLLGAMIGLIVKGLNKVSVVESRTVHQGLKTSVRTTVVLWLSVGLPTMTLIWWYSARILGVQGTFKEAFFFGMMFGLLFGFSYGGLDLIYRFVLRIILWIKGDAPVLVYATALDDAANLGLLRKIGHAYVFYHELIRERLTSHGRVL